MADFRWNDWNLDHATAHGVSAPEAETVVRNARPPYPERLGEGKFRVYGRGIGGRRIHVVFIQDDDGVLYVIHARPVVKDNEKKRIRRRGKSNG